MTTHSELACFRDCPRKRLLRYGYGIRLDQEPGYLTFGRAWHALHEASDIAALTLDPYDRAALDEMWKAYPFKIEYVAVEAEFPPPGGWIGAPRIPIGFQGKLDAIVKLDDGRLALLERKTTASLDDNYWTRLEFDSQVAGYFVAARALGFDVQTVLYDVAEKPSIRPYKATPEDKRKYKADGTLYANQRASDETPAEYARRVAEWLAAEPRFHMRELPMTAQRLADWEADYYQQAQAIRDGAAWRNPAACVLFTPCDYLPICHRSDLDTNTPDGFRRSAVAHEELTARVGLATHS